MEYKEKNFISAVVYVHNAEKQIAAFMRGLISCLETNFDHSEIICVNDCSSDNSRNIIKELAKETEVNITIINLSYFHGLETAINAGMDMSIGDYVLEFDSVECDYEFSLVMDVYRRSLEGYDIVSASPARPQKLSSTLFYKVFNGFTPENHKLSTESFRILSRRVINRLSSMNKTVVYRKALYAVSGFKADKIVYTPKTTSRNPSDPAEKKYRMRLATNCLILFTDFGYRISVFMTAMMMLISIFMVLYTFIAFFTLHPIEGWTTTVLFLSVCFFGLFAILSVIVKYLQIILELVFKRQHYNLESIEKLN